MIRLISTSDFLSIVDTVEVYTDRQTDRQTDTDTHTHIHTHTFNVHATYLHHVPVPKQIHTCEHIQYEII